MPINVFATCSELHPEGSNQSALLQCISDSFQEQNTNRTQDLHSFLFVVAGAMIFFMQAGFAMLCAGSVRIKNVTNTMLKNLLDACGAALAFFLVGYAFAFGGQTDENHTATTLLGSKEFLTVGPSAAFWFFQYTFSATSVTIVAGTLAERCQMAAVRFMYIVTDMYILLLCSVFVPSKSYAHTELAVGEQFLSCFDQKLATHTIFALPYIFVLLLLV